ncbi:hypothetical protein A1O3_06163 [Capronia epimyces CBS 606.96]|uniref:Aminoglycoside phosphotransferase domain-containing protein n=1 Tax=Capronia epimyces CBS 606.96 TaxID=1182542 RepID=W9XYD4_9EURO|nr:uncharacterized protein A1O3_06163 [Capronia epimyces CBS 606.96]EXJ82350.1 hypothetical protein A1O3_06163 [Capronia epimyces CBS 606.96]
MVSTKPIFQTKLGGICFWNISIDEKQGQMLSDTWEASRVNPKLRTNLYRGLSRVMISLAQYSFPRIGSLVIDDHGFVQLESRPLTLDIHTSENEGIPIPMPRDRTYHTVDAHSNILVDEDWNVKHIIDLEWAAVLPLTFMQPLSWLTNEPVDMISLDSYSEQREEFMAAFEQEERSMSHCECIRYSSAMNRSWEIGTFWYILALQNPTALHAIFYNRIQAVFSKEHCDDEDFYLETYPYWTHCANDFIMMKIK